MSFREAASQKGWKSERAKAAEEVGSLPDVLVPGEKRSNILERLSERRRGRHEKAVTSMYHELACIGRKMEPFVLEPGKFLLTKLMRSDRKIELLFKKIESDATLEGFLIEDLEEVWNAIHQETLTRRQWIREMDENFKNVERNQTNEVTDVLRKYTLLLEDISFFLPADVHRFMNNEAMLINRTMLANRRTVASLCFNLMKSEMKREFSYRLKWRDRVKDWKLIRKNRIVHSFREFVAREEIQNPPTVRTEMENILKDQIVLSERRLEILQHVCDLLPPTHTGAEIREWYRSLLDLNESIDTHNVQSMAKIRIEYEMVQQKCLTEMQLCKNNLLNLSVCTEEEAEEVVNSELLPLIEKLQSQFEENLELMKRDFEELAKHNEWNCRDLYSYFQEAMGLWDAHQLKLAQQESELQKRLDESRQKQNNIIQNMEHKLDIILEKMKTASSEKDLKKYLENALSSLCDIRTKYEPFSQVLMAKAMAYPEAVLQELISYSTSISQYFHVKEIFTQNLQGETEFVFRDQELGKAGEAEPLVEQQAESVVQENEEMETDSSQQGNETKTTAENEEMFAQETEEAEQKEAGESIPQGSEEAEHAGQGGSLTQAMLDGSKAESPETFSTSSGNTYTVLGAEEAGKTDIPETYFTKSKKEVSLPMYLKYIFIKETLIVKLKKQIRLGFFEHLEKWFEESLSNSRVVVASKKKELNSELQLRFHLHQQREEDIKTNICNARAEELLLHKKQLDCHRAGVVEALEKEKAEFLRFCDQQKHTRTKLQEQISEMESTLLNAPMNEKLVAFSNNVHSELQNSLEEIQVSLKNYQKYLNETLQKLKTSNMDFLKDCRSFLQGGNFSPEEVNFFRKCIQEENKRIKSFENLINKDMKRMVSNCLGQDPELIKRSKTTFHYIFLTRVFMEKMHRCLKNLQMQIKSEVTNSNLQSEAIKSHLKKFRQTIDACANPAANQEALTAEEIYDFVKKLLDGLKKRSQYLDCLLEKPVKPPDNENFSCLARGVRLQGPIAVAMRKHHPRDGNKVMVMGLDPDQYPVLQPSRKGKSALDDAAISFIKNLLEIQPPVKSSALNQEKKDRLCSSGQAKHEAIPPTSKMSRLTEPVESPQQSAAQTTKEPAVSRKTQRRKIIRYTGSALKDKKLQIFGEKPPESDTFKGAIMNILWKGNNNLLCLAEEFYHTEIPVIPVPKDLPESFQHCVQVFKKSLLSYKSQTDNYCNSCLKEFQDQLKLFGKELPSVSRLAVETLFREHEQKLSYSTGQIQHLFNKQLEVWQKLKAAHMNRLRPSLGHPGNSVQLDSLCEEEIKRQKDQSDGIHLNTQMLQDCVAKCAQNFVSALAAFTEKLLLELDENITDHDVQVATPGVLKENASTLTGCTQARPPVDTSEVQQLTEHRSRTWPGIPMMTLPDNPDYVLCRETASIKTARTTLSHIAAVEARDAVYEKYKCKLEQQLAETKEESAALLRAAWRWKCWWNQSVQKIKHLYT